MKRLLPLSLFAILLACGKKDDVAPVIELTMPMANQTFTGGTTVQIKATITDNESIHMVHCTVTDATTGGHMLHFEEHYDGNTFNLNQSFPTVAGRQYQIHIDATDHDDNV